jgi:hypothetical protein
MRIDPFLKSQLFQLLVTFDIVLKSSNVGSIEGNDLYIEMKESGVIN